MGRLLRWILEIVFWGFTCVAVIAAFSVMVGAGVQPLVAYVAPAIPLVGLPMIGMMIRARRQKRAQQVLVHLEHATRLNLPLVQMMAAARDSERGVMADRLDNLARFLNDGYSMAEALEAALPESSEHMVTTIGAGEQIGRLAPALKRLVEQEHANDDIPDPVLRPFHRIYPLMVVVAVLMCLFLISTFVMPKFVVLTRDFGLQLPPISGAVIRGGNTFVGPLLLLGTTAVIVITGRYFWQMVKPFGLELKPLGVGDRIRWLFPITHGLDLSKGLTEAFALLADAAGAGIPADRAIQEASRLSMNSVLQARLDEWSTRIVEGDFINNAARRARMPAVVVGILSTSNNSETIQPAFKFLERYYRSRFSRANYIVQAMLVPATAMVLGVAVLGVALALFQPLVMMIDKLSVEVWRI